MIPTELIEFPSLFCPPGFHAPMECITTFWHNLVNIVCYYGIVVDGKQISAQDFDTEADNIIGKLKEIIAICFNKRKYTIAYSCDKESQANVPSTN